jgi:hypothetical protein
MFQKTKQHPIPNSFIVPPPSLWGHDFVVWGWSMFGGSVKFKAVMELSSIAGRGGILAFGLFSFLCEVISWAKESLSTF